MSKYIHITGVKIFLSITGVKIFSYYGCQNIFILNTDVKLFLNPTSFQSNRIGGKFV